MWCHTHKHIKYSLSQLCRKKKYSSSFCRQTLNCSLKVIGVAMMKRTHRYMNKYWAAWRPNQIIVSWKATYCSSESHTHKHTPTACIKNNWCSSCVSLPFHPTLSLCLIYIKDSCFANRDLWYYISPSAVFQGWKTHISTLRLCLGQIFKIHKY